MPFLLLLLLLLLNRIKKQIEIGFACDSILARNLLFQTACLIIKRRIECASEISK